MFLLCIATTQAEQLFPADPSSDDECLLYPHLSELIQAAQKRPIAQKQVKKSPTIQTKHSKKKTERTNKEALKELLKQKTETEQVAAELEEEQNNLYKRRNYGILAGLVSASIGAIAYLSEDTIVSTIGTITALTATGCAAWLEAKRQDFIKKHNTSKTNLSELEQLIQERTQ
jgi:hypothetical protein